MDASPPASVSPHPLPLSRLDPGATARVLAVPEGEAERLAAEGLHVGDTVAMEARLPLGGPVVVRLGRARIAISRQVAAGIVVEPGTPPA